VGAEGLTIPGARRLVSHRRSRVILARRLRQYPDHEGGCDAPSLAPGIIDNMLPENRVSTHPGEIIAEDYLLPLGRTAAQLAEHLGVPESDIAAVIRCERAVDADLAWKLGMAFGTSPQFWLNLQSAHDLTLRRPDKKIARLVG
jgi:addiction module HigA family antidote